MIFIGLSLVNRDHPYIRKHVNPVWPHENLCLPLVPYRPTVCPTNKFDLGSEIRVQGMYIRTHRAFSAPVFEGIYNLLPSYGQVYVIPIATNRPVTETIAILLPYRRCVPVDVTLALGR